VEETRERLLVAAEQVIAAQGYEASSVDDIAAAAGLTKGAVYSRFESKEELLFALFEKRAAEGLAALDASLGGEISVEERLAALDQWQRADPARVRVWALLEMELGLLASRQPTMRRRLAESQRQTRRVLAEAIAREATRLGIQLPLPVEDVALVLEAFSDGLTLQRLVDPTAVANGLFARVVQLLLRPR
jgi:AcrR family transcriptional regulator